MEQITASAGSGKTFTLTRRFLARLARALPDGPSRCMLEAASDSVTGSAYSLGGILAATFTNKAAAEMQARVVRELKQQALASGEGDTAFPLRPEHARRWVDAILRRFDSVNIRTIDSLLTLLVRLNALSLSLPPDFKPLFSLDEALSPQYDVLLDQAGYGSDNAVQDLFRQACRSLMAHNRAKGVAAGSLLRERLAEIVGLHLEGRPLPDEEQGNRATAILAALHRDMRDAAESLARFVEEERLAASANARAFLSHCRTCPHLAVPESRSAFQDKWDLDEWLNKASRGCASDDARRAHKDLLSAYAALKVHGPALAATREFMPFISLARPLIAGLEAMQREEGLVPAPRLPSLALEALKNGGVSDAFCRLGDALTHLLFDEFQDTSTTQWGAIVPLVIESLSRGGSLTYVGDVKQAIYGWRGGNAELFDAVAENNDLLPMLANGVTRSTLPCNWRSAPAVVHTNNRVFGRLAEPAFARRVLEAMLPASTEPALMAETTRMLASAFSHSEQEVAERNSNRNGHVRLMRVEAPGTAALLESVKETLGNLLLDDILPRRNPGDAAILVRTNAEASRVAEWLSEWRVPLVTEHSFRLSSHPLITRLADTLAFLEYPLNDAAFWSAVSGPELFIPLGGPERDTLAEWLALTRRAPGGGPLFVAYRKSFPEAWDRLIAPFYDQAGLMSAYDTVRELMRHCRLFERYPEHAPFLRRFAEVAHAAENAGLSSLSAFLEYWTAKGGNEHVPMPETMDAVRILSMHKAKGLEFPVVIVPFHHQSSPAKQPLTVTEAFGLPLLAHRKNSDPEAVRGMVEQINLLYVAWTRPTEELYALITQTPHSASRSALGKALAALLEDLPFKDGVFEHGTKPQPPLFLTEQAPPALRGVQGDHPPDRMPGDAPPCCGVQGDHPPDRIPGDAPPNCGVQGDHPPGGVRGGVPLQSDGFDHPSPPQRLMSWLPRLKIFRNPMDGKGFSERQRGLLAHACLEALHLTDDIEGDIERAVNQGLRAFRVPMPDPDAVRQDMAAMLRWYASLPETTAWIRHGRPEQPLMDTEGNLRRIDLLVNVPGEPLLAVEYKTGQPSPDHMDQVTRYLSLLAPAIRRQGTDRRVRGVVVYLDQREIVQVELPASPPEESPDEPGAGQGGGT